MKTEELWIVLNPDGDPCLTSLSYSRNSAIQAWVGDSKLTWKSWRKLGFRSQPVRLSARKEAPCSQPKP